LENLTSIGDYLNIYNNDALTSLTGIDNIDAGSITNLTIKSNDILSICEVKSICDYLASPNGVVSIGGNDSGCKNIDEVETACWVGLDDETTPENHINIYPNPASNSISIELPTTPNKRAFMTIYNINGQQLIEQRLTEQLTAVDVSGLIEGIYFVRVSDERIVMVEKFVKQ
jgi:hypothetical protein